MRSAELRIAMVLSTALFSWWIGRLVAPALDGNWLSVVVAVMLVSLIVGLWLRKRWAASVTRIILFLVALFAFPVYFDVFGEGDAMSASGYRPTPVSSLFLHAALITCASLYSVHVLQKHAASFGRPKADPSESSESNSSIHATVPKGHRA